MQEWDKHIKIPISVFLQKEPIRKGKQKPKIEEEIKDTIEKVEKWYEEDILHTLEKGVEDGKIQTIFLSEEFRLDQKHTKEANSLKQEELKIWKRWKQTKIQPEIQPKQDFNYHMHTRRCGHAEDVEDEVWVQTAIRAGLKAIAFTDHIPFEPKTKYHSIRPRIRMDYAEIDEYLKSIDSLKKIYVDQIQIESGFEFEYTRQEKEFLKDIRKRVDKMVIGQHFVVNEKGEEYRLKENPTDENLELYADLILEAMEEGLVDIVVHPDYFLSKREGFGRKEEEITRRLCKAAENYQIPLEINLGQLGIQQKTTSVKYPNRDFWKIASEYKIGVIYGKDAHWSKHLFDEEVYKVADAILGQDVYSKLTFLEKDLKTKKKKSFLAQLRELDEEIPEKERETVQKDLEKMQKKDKRKK